MMLRFAIASLLLACVSGCGDDAAQPVTETVAQAPLVLAVQGRGELVPAKATPLRVPGNNWDSRRLEWMLPEGSFVHEGDVIARGQAERKAVLVSRRERLAGAQRYQERRLLLSEVAQLQADVDRLQQAIAAL